MGIYDALKLEGRPCPICGAMTAIVLKHQWGLITMREQRVGDRIIWQSTDGAAINSALYADPIPHLRSWLIRAEFYGCRACKTDIGRPFIIEVRSDVIVDAFCEIAIDRGISLSNELLEERIGCDIGCPLQDTSAAGLTCLAELNSALLEVYATWMRDSAFRHRRQVFQAFKWLVMPEEFTIARLKAGGVWDERSQHFAKWKVDPVILRIGADRFISLLGSVGEGDAILKTEALSLAQEVKERIAGVF